LLLDFFKTIWRCGAVVSIVSVLLLIANYFYIGYLTMSRNGMHALADKRMSMHEVWDWQLYLQNTACKICFVGAIFAVLGGAAYLACRLTQKNHES
jgi:hypothetical protein